MQSELAKKRYLNMLETAFGKEIMGFLHDNSVIEIMLNPDGEVFIDRLGSGMSDTHINIAPLQAENIIKLAASYKNQVVNEEQPYIATEVPFMGARFQGWLPPVVARATFALRKRAVKIFTLDDYIAQGILTQEVADFLRKAVLARKNILVVGGTGSGKTTFTNALLDVLTGNEDRIIVLEDLPELQVKVPNLVSMVTTNYVSMRDLVKGCLRMRPDRIILGEVRDGSALDLLKAWNTGHPGGICTLHANSVESTPYRLEDLIQEVVVTVPKNLILQAIDLIVFIERLKTGERKVQHVAKLTGFDNNQYQFEKVC